MRESATATKKRKRNGFWVRESAMATNMRKQNQVREASGAGSP